MFIMSPRQPSAYLSIWKESIIFYAVTPREKNILIFMKRHCVSLLNNSEHNFRNRQVSTIFSWLLIQDNYILGIRTSVLVSRTPLCLIV
jgi:hypothetical protein